MNLAGGHHIWDSAVFWPAAGIIVGVITIVATIWVTLRAANPKRRLYYWLLSDTLLIRRRRDLSEELKVIYGTRELDYPRVVSVQLVSRSRRDIAREAFDEGKPLCLDLGTPIVECVKVTTSPPDRPDPAWTLDGSMLLIGPSHFGRRQTTVFSLLVDGSSPRITPPQQSLVDVSIEHGDGQAPLGSPRRQVLAGAGVGLVAAFVLAPFTFPGSAGRLATVGVVIAVAVGTGSWLSEFLRRSRG